MSPFTPAWTEAQRRRWTRYNAHLWQKPITRKQRELRILWPAPQNDASASDAVSDLGIESLIELRQLVSDIKCDFEQLARLRRSQLSRKYSSDQPRVPAGTPDGGQWTTGSGDSADRNDPRVLSDATPENVWKPGAQYAQDDGRRIDLLKEEAHGGHTIAQHVAKSPEYLLNRVRQLALSAVKKGDYAQGLVAGSFPSLEAADKLVNSTLAQNQTIVDKVGSGVFTGEEVSATFGSTTGYEAYAPTERSQPYMRDTYGVVVVIRHDPTVESGYRIVTAFPAR